MSAANPVVGIEPIDAEVVVLDSRRAVGNVDVPAAGMWTFRFTLGTNETDEDVVYADIWIS